MSERHLIEEDDGGIRPATEDEMLALRREEEHALLLALDEAHQKAREEILERIARLDLFITCHVCGVECPDGLPERRALERLGKLWCRGCWSSYYRYHNKIVPPPDAWDKQDVDLRFLDEWRVMRGKFLIDKEIAHQKYANDRTAA